MTRYLDLIERTLDEVLPPADARPAVLHGALRYAVGSGGKRLRPVLCLAAAEAVGGTADDARYPAAAVELLHNYTLVHDDLPAMDNDVARRGRPTVWKAFGHANAILAGDALQALAFRTAARAPRNAAAVVAVLGDRGVGVVQGQVEDIDRPPEATDFIYRHKTADLFIAAAQMGALAAGADDAAVDALGRYALNLGLAFQYEDDLLDGDSPYGRERTQTLVREMTAAAVAALSSLPGETAFLRTFAEGLVGRRA
jgi:geranylgeranyl diphosphate synthase type II